jgi:hypothetical protein
LKNTLLGAHAQSLHSVDVVQEVRGLDGQKDYFLKYMKDVVEGFTELRDKLSVVVLGVSVVT